MILDQRARGREHASAPRIRGDDPENKQYVEIVYECSPHTRG